MAIDHTRAVAFESMRREIEAFLCAAVADHRPKSLASPALGWDRAAAVVAIRVTLALMLVQEAIRSPSGLRSAAAHSLREVAEPALYAERLRHYSKPTRPAEIAAAKRKIATTIEHSERMAHVLLVYFRKDPAAPLLPLYRWMHALMPLSAGTDGALMNVYDWKMRPLAAI